MVLPETCTYHNWHFVIRCTFFCLGSVIPDTRVGRRLTSVKCTVVESIPAAAIDMHEHNEVLRALDVTSAVNMNIKFKHPRIVVTVPLEKSDRR